MTEADLHPLDPDLVALAEVGRERGLLPLPEITPAEARERILAGNRLCAAGPDLGSVEDVRIPVAGGEIDARLYRPERPTDDTLLYLHGGGWITGELGYSDELCRFLAHDSGCTVVSAAYRLAPEHAFPVPLEDAFAALTWAAENVHEGGRLGIAGDSAGGNLAAACTLRARDQAGPTIDFQLLIYPVVDSDFGRGSYITRSRAFPLGRADLAYCFDLYAPAATDRATPDVSPVRAGTLAGLPPAVVVVAGHDPLHDEGAAYAERMEAAGVPATLLDFAELCHGFLRFTGASAAAADARGAVVAATVALLSRIDGTPEALDTVGVP